MSQPDFSVRTYRDSDHRYCVNLLDKCGNFTVRLGYGMTRETACYDAMLKLKRLIKDLKDGR